MPDYLDIARRCNDDLKPTPARWSLLCSSDVEALRFADEMADAAAMDLQIAMDNAIECGQQPPVQMELELSLAA